MRPEVCGNAPLVLASQSPRRSDLLREAGYTFEVHPADVEEIMDHDLAPEALTCHNARLKAGAIATRFPDRLVLGVDTLVYIDGKALGKPADLDEAEAMLASLSGKVHEVCSGAHLVRLEPPYEQEFHAITRVHFKDLSPEAIRDYLKRTNPLDKAGAYGIQDKGELIIERIEGSLSNVIGLPMERLGEILKPTDKL